MRKWIALALVLLLGLSMTACGKEEGKYVVGICQQAVHPALDAATQGFQDALKEALGEDKVEFQLQNASGDANTCATIVNTFVSDEVSLIMANGSAALQAAATATADIPVLGTSVTEYGNRLIMMYDGRILVDVSGEQKSKLTVEQLLGLFNQASGSDEADDKLLLSK